MDCESDDEVEDPITEIAHPSGIITGLADHGVFLSGAHGVGLISADDYIWYMLYI